MPLMNLQHYIHQCVVLFDAPRVLHCFMKVHQALPNPVNHTPQTPEFYPNCNGQWANLAKPTTILTSATLRTGGCAPTSRSQKEDLRRSKVSCGYFVDEPIRAGDKLVFHSYSASQVLCVCVPVFFCLLGRMASTNASTNPSRVLTSTTAQDILPRTQTSPTYGCPRTPTHALPPSSGPS